MTAIRLVVAAYAPLTPDETYYWTWSHDLAPGYLDAPFMVALFIRAGTFLLGQNALGVRFLGPLSAALGSILLAFAATDLWPSIRNGGLVAAALLNATLLFGAGAVIMTPDTPLLLFWTGTLWALGRLIRTGNPDWWLLAGLLAGLAADSKYTAFLIQAGVGIWLIALPRSRIWLARWQSWAALVLSFVIFLPVAHWNAAHGWASFIKQGSRVAHWQPSHAFRYEAELLVDQFGLVTPVIFAIFAAGGASVLRMSFRERDPSAALLAVLIAVPAFVFMQHALGARVQGNWPAIVYPAAAIAGVATPICWKLWRWGIALGLTLMLFVYVQALAAPFRLPAHADPTLLQMGGWRQLARHVAAVAHAERVKFIAADEYGLAAELAFNNSGLPVIAVGPRWRYFTLPHVSPRGPVLLVHPGHRRGGPNPLSWHHLTRIGVIARTRESQVAARYVLYLASPKRGSILTLLPQP